jgi:hypothetical protein
LLIGASALGSVKRAKYQLESTKVSRVSVSRVASAPQDGHVEGDVLGQDDGQLVGGNFDRAAGRAVDDRYRAAPVALARDAPVAQAIDGRALARAGRLDPSDGLGLGGLDVQPVQEVGVVDQAGTDIGFVVHGEVVARALGANDRDHRQVVFSGEVQIALVMRRAGEDGARAVFRQDEVGDPDRNLGAGEGMDGLQPGVPADLLGLFDVGLGRAALAAFGDEVGDVRIGVGQLFRNRMIRRQTQEAGSEQSVWTGGVDLDAVVVAGRRRPGPFPGHLQTLGPADPVLLHQPDLFRPAVQGLQPVDQVVGIVGDAQEPLVQLALLDDGAGTPATPVDDLFIGQNGVVDRVPVDDPVLAIDQTAPIQLQEPGLLLAIVFRVAGGELARPVQRQTQELQLFAHVGDVGIGPALGVDAALHGRVLGRHAESVPAHRVQDVEALGALGPRDHVAHHIVAGVTHVDGARRIGEHLQHIVFRTAGILRHEGGGFGPAGLLAGFGGLGVVSGHGRPESRKGR